MLKAETGTTAFYEGREFPCPICGMGLQIRSSQRQKPYCICDLCGVQVFIRGKKGIKRLRELLEDETIIPAKDSGAGTALSLYNRLRQLKTQKRELEGKQGFIFRDPDLDNAISAVEKEIDRIKAELGSVASKGTREKKK
jgi:hypothetical protein